MREDWESAKINDLLTSNDIFCDGDWIEKKDQDPNGKVRLIQLADIGDGFFRDKSKRFVNTATANRLNCTFLKQNDIIIARMPDPIGRATIFPLKGDNKFITAVDVAIIRLSSNYILKKYMLFLINSPIIRNKIEALQSGTTRKRISRKNLAKINFPIPPLPEQRAIIAKIEQLFSELDNGIANLKTAQEQLKVYRQAVLKKAFEGDLTKEWRESYSGRGQGSGEDMEIEEKGKGAKFCASMELNTSQSIPKDNVKTQNLASQPASQPLSTGLPTAEDLLTQIKAERETHYQNQLDDWQQAVNTWEANGKQGKKPRKPGKLKEFMLILNSVQKNINKLDSWANVNLENCTSKIGDGLHGTPNYSDGEYYFINGNNLKNGRIIFKKSTKKVNQEEYNKYKKTLNKTTVLVSINGTLGSTAFFNNEDVILGKSACYINTLPSINKYFLRWNFETNEFKNYLSQTATGSTIKNVPLKAIRNYIFPICSPSEQHQIVQEIESRLSVCDKVEENIEESLTKAEALRQSILKKAFEGKLLSESELTACRQEPDWEPAEKLLERIRAEK